MRQSIIISDINSSTLQIVLELAEKNSQTALYLLSDAVFMLNDDRLSEVFNRLYSRNVKIFFLEEDVEKRNPAHREGTSVISYETFVDRLLSKDTHTINL